MHVQLPTVTEFFPDRSSEAEWWGGTHTVRVLDHYGKPVMYGNKTREEMRNNSAYMLMYKRKKSGPTEIIHSKKKVMNGLIIVTCY